MAPRINAGLRRVPTWPVYLAGTLPALWLTLAIFTGGLGVDPARSLELQTGLWSLKFLIAGLCVTPLRRLTGVNLIRYRRALGLLAFFYAALHVVIWLVLYIQFRWAEILADLLMRPFITIGTLSFLLMFPLVATSNAWSVRRLGPGGWSALHRLTYVVIVLGAVHYLLAVKAWPQQPVIYFSIVLALVAIRLLWALRRWLGRTSGVSQPR